MNYCPYCGAVLPGSAISFCPECGKGLPRKKTQPDAQERKRGAQKPVQKRKCPPKPHRPKQPQKPLDPMDDGYDGYYEDIPPMDAGARGEGMDPELLKRVGLIVLGAIGVIILAVILMMVL